ncbi:MAG TPA: hypothetical protein VFU02_14905 [Polyangiaceae bacterium]|nr:hypothetical protein [Polyangiaceae bacterium]
MAIPRCPVASLLVGACVSLVLAACGDSAADGGSTEAAASDTSAGPGTLTSTGSATQGSSATFGSTNTNTSVETVSATASSMATGSASTTGAGGAGGVFSDTTTGGDTVSTSGVGPGGAGGTTASGGASTTSSSISGTGGAGVTAGNDSSASNGGSGGGSSECAFSGNISYQFNQPEGWPEDVVELLTTAMDEAIYYYNCYADLEKQLTINYDPGVPTAQGNVDGWISFGTSRSYMVVATAMHEVAHTLGVGYSPWVELMQDSIWTGPAVVEFMTNLPADQRDADMYSQRTYITGDSQHFWPYGLNQASEHQSEWSLINHVRIVAAMQLDKQAYLAGDL